MRSVIRRILSPVLCVALLGPTIACADEVAVQRWDPLDYDNLMTALAQPTGTLDAETVYQVAAIAKTSIEVATVLLAIVRELERMLSRSTRKGGIDTKRREGTNVFVRISCPGADPTKPVTDFSEGAIVVEAPVELDLADFAVDVPGDALVRLRDCVLGTWLAYGDSAAYLDPYAYSVGLEANFELEGPGGGGIGFPVISDETNLSWQVFFDGDSFSVALDRKDPDVVILRGSNTTYRCQFSLTEDLCTEL